MRLKRRDKERNKEDFLPTSKKSFYFVLDDEEESVWFTFSDRKKALTNTPTRSALVVPSKQKHLSLAWFAVVLTSTTTHTETSEGEK